VKTFGKTETLNGNVFRQLTDRQLKARRLALKMCIGAFIALCSLSLSFVTAPAALAAIPCALRSSLMREFKLSPRFDFSKGINASAIQPVQQNQLRSEDVAKVIPSNMAPTNNSGLVAGRIIDQSVSTWFNSDAVRATSFGRTAHGIEKSLQGDVKLGGSSPQSIQHKLRFQVKAAQTQAQVLYSGLTNAKFTYFLTQNKSDLELSEPMPVLNTNVVYNHTTTPDDRREMLSLRWKF
jgi:hypothetical protein